MATYVKASTVEEAVAAMAAGARPVAGGTDLVVGSRQGKKPLPEALVGIHRIPGLAEITKSVSRWEIGALVTHRQIVEHPELAGELPGLADASAIVGSHATRANGTIGGNLMNASPAMDTGAPLLTLGAKVRLVGPSGERTVDLADLWSGPGTTSALPDELLVAVEVPRPAPASGYVRLQYRRQMEIAVVGVGAAVVVSGDAVTDARLAITALAPTIHRVAEAERILVESGDVDAAAQACARAARPIDDVRASAEYRRAMTVVMARRAIATALARAKGQTIPVPASESTFGS